MGFDIAASHPVPGGASARPERRAGEVQRRMKPPFNAAGVASEITVDERAEGSNE
jgi:hypothetical protein